jgi:hypothetical protein
MGLPDDGKAVDGRTLQRDLLDPTWT